MLIPLLALATLQTPAVFEAHPIATLPDGIEFAEEFDAASASPHLRPTCRAGFDRGATNHVGWTLDGLEAAYVGARGEELVACVNEEIIGTSERVFAPTVGWRAGEIAFRAATGMGPSVEWTLFQQRENPQSHHWIGPPSFSPKDGTIVYWTSPEDLPQPRKSKNRHEYVMYGGPKRAKPKIRVDTLSAPSFSVDGKSFLSAALDDDGWQMFRYTVGSKERSIGSSIGLAHATAISPNGKEWAESGNYVDRKRKGTSVASFFYSALARKGKPVLAKGAKLDREVARGIPVFSPDGKRLAHKVVLGGERMTIGIDQIVVDLGPCSFVTRPVWKPDSKALAVVMSEGIHVIRRGAHLSPRDDAYPRDGDDAIALITVAGTVEVLSTNLDRVESLTFSPDGARLAYAEQRGKQWYVVCRTHEAGPFDEVGRLQFDDEGQRIAFGAVRGRKITWEVLRLGD